MMWVHDRFHVLNTKPDSSDCQKHLPSSAGHGGNISDRHVSSELPNKLLRNTSSEKDAL